LFRLKEGLLADFVPAARHLYSYIMAWLAVALTAASLASLLARRERLSELLTLVWRAFVSMQLIRESTPVISVMAYQPSVRWLPVIPITPLLTILTWAASIIASLSRNKVSLQFKGARSPESATRARNPV
jgi:hypothetical protein